MGRKHTSIKQIKITGRVQGVGFRYFTKKTAQRLSVNGWVKNMEDGSVEAVLAGDEKNVLAMRDELKKGPAAARVAKMEEIPTGKKPDDFNSFTVKR